MERDISLCRLREAKSYSAYLKQLNYYTSTTKYNCGVNLHARQIYACVTDRRVNKLVHTNIIGNHGNSSRKHFKSFPARTARLASADRSLRSL